MRHFESTVLSPHTRKYAHNAPPPPQTHMPHKRTWSRVGPDSSRPRPCRRPRRCSTCLGGGACSAQAPCRSCRHRRRTRWCPAHLGRGGGSEPIEHSKGVKKQCFQVRIYAHVCTYARAHIRTHTHAHACMYSHTRAPPSTKAPATWPEDPLIPQSWMLKTSSTSWSHTN